VTRSAPLADLRVLEIVDLRGALCGRMLADLGADVLHVALGAHDTASSAIRYRHANKRGARLDLDVEADRARLDAWLSQADVLVENLGPARAQALALDVETIGVRYPRLIHVALSDFGLDGPRADWHLEALPAFAASGAHSQSGFPTLPPCWLPGHIVHDCASVYGALGAVAALLERDRSGSGQWIEVSAQEAGCDGLFPWAIPLADYHRNFEILPDDPSRAADGAYLVLPAKDGHVRIVLGHPAHWRAFFELCGRPDVLAGPEWEGHVHRLLNADVIRIVAQERLTDRTRAQLVEQASELGCPLGAIHSLREYVEAPQSRARESFVASAFPHLGDAPFLRPPLRLSATPCSLRRPAPEADEDDRSDFAARRRVLPDPDPGTGPAKPLLDGLRVIEFGVAAVGPEAALMLSQLGARVIKVESNAHLDVLRYGNVDGDPNHSWSFNCECRGRESVLLDLRTERGRALAFELCLGADVVIENNRGGVMASLGLGAEALRAANPRLVTASSQGYGRDGPLAQMPAFGPLNSAFAGIHGLWNHPDAPYPCASTLNHPDHIAGKLLATGILVALRERERSGEGQHVELAQTETAAFLMGEFYMEEALRGRAPVALGNRSEDAVPHDVYPCAGEDRWVAIAVADDDAWRRLETLLGGTRDPALSTLSGRRAHREAIDARISDWTRTRSREDAAALLQAAGVSAMMVQGPADHRSDPHLRARGAIVCVEHPGIGPEHHMRNPMRPSRTHVRTASAAPLLGADTRLVLTGVLGLDAEEVERLVESGVCS